MAAYLPTGSTEPYLGAVYLAFKAADLVFTYFVIRFIWRHRQMAASFISRIEHARLRTGLRSFVSQIVLVRMDLSTIFFCQQGSGVQQLDGAPL